MNETEKSDYKGLRKEVADLQDYGFAPEKSQYLLSREQEAAAGKEKLTPALIKKKTKQLLADQLATLKGTAAGTVDLLKAKASESVIDFMTKDLTDATTGESYLIAETVAVLLIIAGTLVGSSAKLNAIGYVLGQSAGGVVGIKVAAGINRFFRKHINKETREESI